MKKSILKSSIALAVAGVFGATVAVTAAEQATPVPVTQEVAATTAPVAQPATHQVVPTIQVTPAAKVEAAPAAAKTEVAPATAKVEVTPAVKVVPTAAKVEVAPVAPVAQDTTPVPTATQDVKTPVAQETVVPSTENPAAAVPSIETASVAKAPSEPRVVRSGDKKSDSVAKHGKEVKNTKKAAVDKAPKVKVVKDEKKADKEEPTKEEKKTLKVENHNLAQPTSKKA